MDRNITQLRTVDGETLMSQPLRPPDFVVDSLLSQGLHILAGSPKVGKSWLALWLAVTVAKGEPVWDMAARQGVTPKKVSRLILQSAETLRKAGITATVRRSNGKRIIHLKSADSADNQAPNKIGTIDPVS